MGSHGSYFIAIPTLHHNMTINSWIARLRICLCDHLCFVVEDSEYEGESGKQQNKKTKKQKIEKRKQ
jgi:hypothetical protein